MTLVFACEVVLAGLLVAIATWTIVARTAFAAIVLFMVYGLLLAIVWVALSAVDVALTEAAIGGGVTSMLLMGAATRLRAPTTPVADVGLPLRIAAGLLCALVTTVLGAVVFFLPDVAPTLAPVAKDNLAASGLGNPVAAVLFVFRALDTLLEKVVLLLALVGVWSLASDEAWGGVPGLPVYARPGRILVFLAQILPPIGIIVGIYMFWAGASQPGGAFQGGTILAAVWLLTMMARLQDVPAINARWLRLLLVVGPTAFLAIGLAGFFIADSFLAYPPGISKPLIIVVEATLTLSIGVTLALLVAGPPERLSQR
jgi:multisubunit Na+/H+ antiporter MnhB subunit